MMSFTSLSALIVTIVGVHLSNACKDFTEVEFFQVGMTARGIYTAPGDGRTTINVEDVNGGVVLHMDYRFKWGGNPSTGKPWEHILVLNTKPDGGSWGAEQHVNNFYFTPGTTVELSAKAEEGHFAISVNGKQIAIYDYRLPVDSVRKVIFTTEGDSVLLTLSLDYN